MRLNLFKHHHQEPSTDVHRSSLTKSSGDEALTPTRRPKVASKTMRQPLMTPAPMMPNDAKQESPFTHSKSIPANATDITTLGEENIASTAGRLTPKTDTQATPKHPTALPSTPVTPTDTADNAIKATLNETNARLKPPSDPWRDRAHTDADIEQLLKRGLHRRVCSGEQSVATLSLIHDKTPPKKQTVRVEFSPMPLPKGLSAGKLYATKRPALSTAYQELFFQQIIENKIEHLVDLRELESPKKASEDYRPLPGTTRLCGTWRISAEAQPTSPPLAGMEQYTLRFNKAAKAPGESEHVVQVNHYTQWPDFNTITPEALRELSGVVTTPLTEGKNVLVHCGGGIGRTGTLVTYSQMRPQIIRLALHTRPLTARDIDRRVANQREQNCQHRKAGCIETMDQYNLVCKTLIKDYEDAWLLVQEPHPNRRALSHRSV